MILNKKIDIKASTRNISYLKSVDINIKLGDIISIIPNEYPFKKGNFIIDVQCDVCDIQKSIKWENYIINTNNLVDIYCCSEKCSTIKRNARNLTKYGVKNVLELDSIKELIKNTNFTKYGGHPVKNDLIKKKIKDTMLYKYGVDSAIKNLLIKEQIKNTCIDRYGVDNPLKLLNKEDMVKIRLCKSLDKVKSKYSDVVDIIGYHDNDYDCMCKLCNQSFYINNNILRERVLNNKTICTKCFPIYSSYPEIEICNILDTNNITYERKNRSILGGKELDFYIPDLKLALEFNGVYWHSTNWKEKTYHIDKFLKCNNDNINLFQIWEDDWKNKRDIVVSMILNKLGKNISKIGARKCIIKELHDIKIVKDFLNDNHIQGWCVSKINIGLFYNDELVSIMTFGRKRISLGSKNTNPNEYELLRFCNKLNTTVSGGSSRLFKFFLKKYEYNSIISYSNNDHSLGGLYEVLGFSNIGITSPGYFYINNLKRINRFSMRKSELVKLGYDSTLTEQEISKTMNFLKIYNSGNKKYIYKNPKI